MHHGIIEDGRGGGARRGTCAVAVSHARRHPMRARVRVRHSLYMKARVFGVAARARAGPLPLCAHVRALLDIQGTRGSVECLSELWRTQHHWECVRTFVCAIEVSRISEINAHVCVRRNMAGHTEEEADRTIHNNGKHSEARKAHGPESASGAPTNKVI